MTCGRGISKSSMEIASLHRLLILGHIYLSENDFNPVLSLFCISAEVIPSLYTRGNRVLLQLFFLICALGASVAHLSFSPL